jgi:hypothetical protein
MRELSHTDITRKKENKSKCDKKTETRGTPRKVEESRKGYEIYSNKP